MEYESYDKTLRFGITLDRGAESGNIRRVIAEQEYNLFSLLYF